ncbi:MAG: TonB-dependent receptor plug domain-containing protein [Gemmatimonadota bacterium]|nr:TonB-dependent receptor plug domain-containing protein [Gemmatimonadota bacterium]
MFPIRSSSQLPMVVLAAATMFAACAPNTSPARQATRHMPTDGPQPAEGQTIADMFAGKFPGVQVVRAQGGGITLRIRGAGTLYNDGEPLILVDGMRIMSGNGGLQFLNPADIATIEIVKDVGALAFYGIQGANGVVLIRTKRAQ